MTNLTNQRQVFVEEYVRSGDPMTSLIKFNYSILNIITWCIIPIGK